MDIYGRRKSGATGNDPSGTVNLLNGVKVIEHAIYSAAPGWRHPVRLGRRSQKIERRGGAPARSSFPMTDAAKEHLSDNPAFDGEPAAHALGHVLAFNKDVADHPVRVGDRLVDEIEVAFARAAADCAIERHFRVGAGEGLAEPTGVVCPIDAPTDLCEGDQ